MAQLRGLKFQQEEGSIHLSGKDCPSCTLFHLNELTYTGVHPDVKLLSFGRLFSTLRSAEKKI